MPGKIKRAKKNTQIKKKLSAKEITAHNLKVAQLRRKELRHFALEFRARKQPLDPGIRSISVRFTQLPFGIMVDSCGGHFSKKMVASSLDEIPFSEVKPGEKVYFGGANFEMMLDYSPEAMRFRNNLKKFEERYSFVKFRERGDMISFGLLGIYMPKTREEITALKTENTLFVKDFKKVVNLFVKRYGIGRNKLKEH